MITGRIRAAVGNLTFRNKLFLSYVLTIILPVSVLGVYSYQQARSFLLQQAETGIQNTVRQVSDTMDYKVSRYDQLIGLVAYNKRIQQIITNNYRYHAILYLDYLDQVDPVFQSILKQNDDVSGMTLFTGGEVPEYGDFILSLDRVSGMPWFQAIRGTQHTRWVRQGEDCVGLHLVENEDPTLEYLTRIRVNAGRLFAGLSALEGHGGAVVVADDENQVVYLHQSGENAGMPELENFRPEHWKAGVVQLGNTPMLLTVQEVTSARWRVYAFLPLSSLTLDIRSILKMTGVVILLCLSVLLLLSWLFSNGMVRRIQQLKRQMDRVQKGEMELDIASPYTDEIGQLTSQFGKMLDEINILIREVYQSRLTQKESELKALQAQINPHFLYNTLSIINWKALEIDADEISHLTVDVSNYYRGILNKGRNLLSVREELENCRIYLDIQLIMHNNSFGVCYRIEESVCEWQTLNILLQPVVENAVQHGIEQREDPEGGLITVEAREEAGCICFRVEDNGPGMDEETAARLLTQHTRGYGLRNVHDRIRLFFGEAYGVTLETAPGKGCSVTLRIPCHPREGGCHA